MAWRSEGTFNWKHSRRLVLGLAVALVGACGSPGSESNGAGAPIAHSAPDERVIAPLRAVAAWANRTLTPAEIDTYTRTPSVLESLRVQRRELALARLCWPETRAMDQAASGRRVPEERYRESVRALGLDPDEVECPPEPDGRPATAPAKAQPATGGGRPSLPVIREPEESFSAVLASSQAVYATLMPAHCEGLIQLPDPNVPIPPIRRRWAGEVRIAAPADDVLRAELRRVLADPRLHEAVRGLRIRLVDRNPNVVVRGLNEAERCYDTDPLNGLCGAPFLGRCGGTRFRKYDRLAGGVTAGRRSYLRDASDFAGTDLGSPVFGFSLSDSQGRIEGAVCLLADEAVGGPAALGPEYSREAKAALAAECVAHVLGLGGPPSSIRPVAPRSRRMLVTLDRDGRVVLSNTAIALLTESYSR